MNVSRRAFLGAAGAAALPLRAQERKPNIIFVLADDLGYGDLGCYGQQTIATPRIDTMASEGLKFTEAYAGSTVCAPSRSCLMTGQHTGHTRIRGNSSPIYGRVPLLPEDATVAEVLKQAGYRTAMFGKWGLGEAGTTGTPNKKGFDEFFGYLNQGHAHSYYPEHLWHNETEVFLRGNRGAQQNEYSHDLIVERALAWTEKAADADQPFFLYLPFTVPHADNELGRDTGDGMPVPDYAGYGKKGWPTPEAGFAAMVDRLDRDVGRLLDLLARKGIAENTLVIFASDNGPHAEGGHSPEFFESRGGLRGIKRDLYEGGIRTPAIARWPGKIRPGRVSDHNWAFWDFLPTAAAVAGAAVPEDVDGLSFLPELLGREQPRHEYLYWEIAMSDGFEQAARAGDWKGVRHRLDGPVELYDLAGDPREQEEISAKHPEQVQRMKAIFREAHAESEAFPMRGRS